MEERTGRNTTDPFWWSLFGAGGALTAIFLPILALLFGVATPLGWVDAPSYQTMRSLITNPLFKLVLFGFVSLAFFHWAHRFRFTLYDGLQLKHLFGLIAAICYGGAALGAVAAAVVIW